MPLKPSAPGDLDAAVESSAAPALARVAIERLADAHGGLRDRLVEDPGLATTVVAVCAASRSLTQLLETDAQALDVLARTDHRRPPPVDGDLDEGALQRWKALEYLRIAARDLTGLDDMPTTARAVADMAGDVVRGACAIAEADGLVVIGMGKLGGQELNYASDIDLMFVADDACTPKEAEGAAREVMAISRQCFRVDANLRPEGRDGPLTRTVPSFQAYWSRWAQPWERQALLKARPVAGPPTVAAAWVEAAEAHLWGEPLGADELRSLRTMKARTEAQVARKGMSDRELKTGVGGIRDIEFAVQLLQLVHGRHDPALRCPSTLDALAELSSAGYVAPDDADSLARCYRFLRDVEHRVQLVDERQLHAVPSGAADRERLAKVLGFSSTPDASALEAFDAELARTRSTVRTIHERLYFRPLLEAFAGAPGRLTAEAAATRLAAFGFSQADRTRQAVAELTKGLTRSSRLMHQLLPLLLGWLSDSPDPDRGLMGLRTLASGVQRSTELARAFRESPESARRLCTLIGTSRLLTDVLERNPDLIPDLGDDDAIAPLSKATLLEKATTALEWRDPESRLARLRRFKEREVLRITARDVLDLSSVDATAEDLTALAEATVEGALLAVAPSLPFAVVALGRFGGVELSYGSDLDVIFVYEGATDDDRAEAERVATQLLRGVKGANPSERIYELDADLRPEGRQGPLARSLDGYRSYFERWADVWERQAMLRARPVAGDPELAGAFIEMMAPFVWDAPLSETDEREIRRIKARVERERIPAGEDPQFHLKLGRGSLSDIEFCAQLLQLRHGVRAPGTMEALARLAAADVLAHDDMEVLAGAYRFCERARNRLFLVHGSTQDALPQHADELGRLARSLDSTPVEVREGYRRVTRRSRAVVERLFYGVDR
ncbi:MAG TPA: bifunctional [glutamine synthetase] adenylyltransferase/[glutamine synthetase]-adenylyl-L-tyrosine phosphorylase [Acidimicrobiales bacterium]|nr:bifunctional [glutamine synthetase] adenylyltransferase/[glutamine synthetase]-adenylyl-L-tyrosine phosphorylase [Acidimicrobiales bacterium]